MSIDASKSSPIIKQTNIQVGGMPKGTYKSAGGAQRTVNIGGSKETYHANKRAALQRALNNRSIEVTTVTNNYGTAASSGSGVNAGSIFGALTAAAGLGLGVAQMARGFGGASGVAGAAGDVGDVAGSASSTSFSGKLGNAKSFGEIKGVQQEIESKKANLKKDYADISMSKNVGESLKREGVEDGLKLAGVQISPDQFKLDENIDSSKLDEAQKTIDSDINKMTNLQTSTLPKDLAKVTAKKGEIGQSIASKNIDLGQLEAQKKSIAAAGESTTQIDAQIKALKEEIKKLEGQKKQLENAETTVRGFISQCGETIEKLKAKQAELADMQKTEASIKDKEYSLAESQDKELQQTMAQIDKLTKEINDLEDKDPKKATGSDQKRLEKYNKLIQQRTGLYTQLASLAESLGSAGKTTFENSKGKSYTLKNLDKALQYGQNKPDVTPTNGSATQAPAGSDTLNSMKDNITYSINGHNVKKSINTFFVDGKEVDAKVFRQLVLTGNASGLE